MKVIVYKDGDGVGVLIPSPEFADSIAVVVAKDVPQGSVWRLMNYQDLPDPTTRNGWRWTDAGALDVVPIGLFVPKEVSRFQAKAALAMAGKLAQADAAVAASNDPILQLAWAEATTFKRNSPGIAALAGGIGLDDAALDDLFRTAAGIVA